MYCCGSLAGIFAFPGSPSSERRQHFQPQVHKSHHRLMIAFPFFLKYQRRLLTVLPSLRNYSLLAQFLCANDIILLIEHFTCENMIVATIFITGFCGVFLLSESISFSDIGFGIFGFQIFRSCFRMS